LPLPLTIIICTFQREKAIADNLRLIFGPKVQSTGSIDPRVIVVDQGKSIERSDFPENWNLRVVHQDNFGGAGGFARGMIEAIDEGAGWILLMDDDATPDPASFPILADYIFSSAPDTRFALHGAMFSSEQPDTIYEAGATIKEPRDRNFDIVQRLRGYKPSTPLEKDPKLWESTGIDYGAWWFFCLHTDSIREVGLPLPLFIRGDDCEYGIRLKAHDIKTLPLPGLRVWHPSHSARLDRWYILFDWRNKLICKALHGPASPYVLARTIWRRVFYRLLGAEYDAAELMIAGIEEYMKGPSTLQNDSADVVAKARHLSRQHVEFASHNDRKLDVLAKATRRGLRRVVQTALLNGLFLPARQTKGCLSVFRDDQVDWMQLFRVSSYGAISQAESEMRLHKRSSRIFMKLLLRLCFLTTKYIGTFGSLSADYRRHSRLLSGVSWWKSYLSIN